MANEPEKAVNLLWAVDRAKSATASALPTVAQLEEAATRSAGASDIFADIRPPERRAVAAWMAFFERGLAALAKT